MRYLLSLGILFFIQCSGHIYPDLLVGTYNALKPEFRYLSLFHGAELTESKDLLRMYLSDSQTSTAKLIRKLFFKNWHQLAPTVALGHPATYLDPKDLAILIAYLHAPHENLLPPIYKRLHQRGSKASNSYKKPSFNGHINVLTRLLKEAYDADRDACCAILLSFFYQKYRSKDDIITFYKTVHEHLECMQDEALLRRMIPNDQHEMELIENIHSYYLSIRPHQLAQNYIDYQDALKIPDCMETVLREFCNMIFYDPIVKRFNVERINHLKLFEDIYFFYNRTTTMPDRVQSYQHARWWYHLVSHNPYCEYVLDEFEMIPSRSNFLHAINYLFDINAQSGPELAIKLSNHAQTITCTERIMETQDGETNVFDFVFTDTRSNVVSHMTIHLNPKKDVWHGWVYLKERDNIVATDFAIN